MSLQTQKKVPFQSNHTTAPYRAPPFGLLIRYNSQGLARIRIAAPARRNSGTSQMGFPSECCVSFFDGGGAPTYSKRNQASPTRAPSLPTILDAEEAHLSQNANYSRCCMHTQQNGKVVEAFNLGVRFFGTHPPPLLSSLRKLICNLMWLSQYYLSPRCADRFY